MFWEINLSRTLLMKVFDYYISHNVVKPIKHCIVMIVVTWHLLRGSIFTKHHTVKNNCNFTDPVMGNCDKKSTGNRKFTGKCPYILYING